MMGAPRVPLRQRLYSRCVRNTETGCLEWRGALTNGYGRISSGAPNATLTKAHRAAWLVEFGSIPAGVCVLHKCDNRKCVEVEHLFLGSIEDNHHDAMGKCRHSHHESHGNASIDMEKARSIRRWYALGCLSQRDVAYLIGTTRAVVCSVLAGRTWRECGCG